MEKRKETTSGAYNRKTRPVAGPRVIANLVTPSPPFQNGMAQTRCHVSSVYVVFLLCLSWIFTLSDLLMFSVLSLFFLRIINNFSFLLCCHFWHIHQWWSYCNKCRGFNCHTSQRVTSLPYLAESGLSTIPR